MHFNPFYGGGGKSAFTLAEVLITLGIIGVVAAITMPTLIANVQDKVLETQRSKAKNILANGYKKLMADNEVFSLSETPLNSCNSTDCIDAEHKSVFKTVKSGVGLAGLNLPDTYLDKDGNEYNMDWENKYIFVTPDGYVYGLDVDAFLSEKTYNIYTDVNGAKNPSKEKKDLVLFTVSDKGVVAEGDIQNRQCSEADLDACTQEQCMALEGSYHSDGFTSSCGDFGGLIGSRAYYVWSDGGCKVEEYYGCL